MNKIDLVRRAEAQLEMAYQNMRSESQLKAALTDPRRDDFRHWRWRVGVIEQDIFVRNRLAFSAGEHVLFTVVDWSKDLPVQAFSFKNNIVTGLFFNDLREVAGANEDLTNFDFSTMPAITPEVVLGELNRTIYSDIMKATRMHWGQNEGVELVDKNTTALLQMALRPGRIPDEDEVAFKYPGNSYIPLADHPLQSMKMSDLEGAKPLDGLNWFLVGPEITLRLS